MSQSSLDDRVIAIAGVGGGLGPVVASRLAEAGAIVAGTDRDQGTLDALASELAIPADRWDGRAVDLLDEGAARGWCAALTERFGRVDALIHLVGGWRGGEALHEAPLADWDLLHDLLVRTVQHTTRAFHDALAASDHGRFVLVSAKQAQRPSNANAAYAAAKAAAEAWTLALADGFATLPPADGTKASDIRTESSHRPERPADGPETSDISTESAHRQGGATANIVVVDAILTPLMRADSPGKDFPTFTPAEHIAEAIAFLCSDAAAKMNGQRLALHA